MPELAPCRPRRLTPTGTGVFSGAGAWLGWAMSHTECSSRAGSNERAADRTRPWSGRPATYDRSGQGWQGGFYGQGRRWSGEPFEPEGHGGRDTSPDRSREIGRSARSERYNQSWSGFAPSPYDEGEVGAWYGGDTGMGDPGSSGHDTPWESGSQWSPGSQPGGLGGAGAGPDLPSLVRPPRRRREGGQHRRPE